MRRIEVALMEARAMPDRPIVTVQNEQNEANGPVETQTAAPAAIPEVVPLPEVLRQIRRDSRRDPQQYLDETIVPFGGE